MEEIKKCMRQVKTILPVDCGVLDTSGVILAATDDSLEGETDPSFRAVMSGGDIFASTADRTYLKVNIGEQLKYVIYVESTDADAKISLQLISEWIKTIAKEKGTDAEKSIFIRNVLLDNEIRSEVPMIARGFKIDCKDERLVIVVRTAADQSTEAFEILQNLYNDSDTTMVISMDDTTTIVIIDSSDTSGDEAARGEFIDDASQSILACLNSEGCVAKVAVGSIVPSFMDISKSYSDAMTALKVSKIFDGEQDISRYDKLGLGRLIYQLPKPLCEMFIREVFPNDAFRQLDEETRTTIDTFFANDLNGSETSRELFVHRNTLVYRLEKVKTKTGLDLRKFDDAVLFKMATMVRIYIDYLNDTNDNKIR
ncbi:MAG: helix-turn-helix domain-containing protein [Clostridiales bacterium]|nr:helix-turn-helix domain-containing protein [Clostridiales bacterium]MCR5615938.1 helix-turn-helix domain-containing protein [Saccharofermentans sp.]